MSTLLSWLCHISCVELHSVQALKERFSWPWRVRVQGQRDFDFSEFVEGRSGFARYFCGMVIARHPSFADDTKLLNKHQNSCIYFALFPSTYSEIGSRFSDQGYTKTEYRRYPVSKYQRYPEPSVNDTQIPVSKHQRYPEPSVNDTQIPVSKYQRYPEPSINDTQIPVSKYQRYPEPSINDTQIPVSKHQRYPEPSVNDTQIPVSNYQRYPEPSVNDTQIPVSNYQRYPEPSINDTPMPVSKYQWYPKQSINAQNVGVRIARPIDTAQKPLASLIWHRLDYIRVVSSSLCLKAS